MRSYRTEQIRNVGLFSHGGAGKTSLTEAMLFNCKAINRLGRVDEGSTVSDYDPDEVKRHISVNTSVAPCEWQDVKINVLDAPGYADFIGETKAAMRIADSALILIDATGGVEVGTDQVWNYAQVRNIPRILFINKLDRENASFNAALEAAQSAFGSNVVPLQLPLGKETGFRGLVDLIRQKAYIYSTNRDGKFEEAPIPPEMEAEAATAREKLVERIVEGDDDLMMRYLDGDTSISAEELLATLGKAICNDSIFPVLCGSATLNIGISQLLDMLAIGAPSPLQAQPEENLKPTANGPLAVLVFKTAADPYVGKLTYFKVFSGTFKGDGTIYNGSKGASERIGQLYHVRGKEQMPCNQLEAGDIGAVAKLQVTQTGDTIGDADSSVRIKGIDFPSPLFRAAVKAKSKADLEKIGTALNRLVEEDPTIKVERDPGTGETIMSGMGESHVQVSAEKLHRKFGVDVTIELPKVPYRETIMGSSKAEYKHKKQTGGHGQYGHVHIEVTHTEDGEFEFTETVVGGNVPRNYIPAVEKGIREILHEGPLAGFPVTNIKVNLFDGSYHPVDSSEMAFKIAAQQAFKKGALEAKPALLEPIADLKVTVPDSFVGDVMGDLTSARRGRVLGMDQVGSGFTVIEAQAPLAEVQRYATDLRSMTQGRGIFSMVISHYEVCPNNIADQIITTHKKELEAAHAH
ncbi:MAG: translation elongation factor [Chloroflexi bacterium]|jgi:elongation factor G|nr:translation elongation factor [Chloroflexota bacterium]